MSDSALPTKWIVAGLLLGGAVVICLILLVAALRGDGSDGTQEPTTSTPSFEPTTSSPRATTTSSTEPPIVDEQTLTVDVAGQRRTAIVMTPLDAAAGEQLPVVLALHGLGVDAAAMSRGADWRGAVAQDRFMAVFPQGTNNSWNMGPCCPPANLLEVDDTAFLDALMAELTARSDVDDQRMFLTGFSNGALMVYSYACARSEVFAAVAPMSGSNVTGCAPSRPLSLLHQHGDADVVVPYRGGVALGSLVSSAPFPAVEDSVAAWAAADGCPDRPLVTTEGGVVRTDWNGCADGTRVELVTVRGKGHEWVSTASYDALAEMLGFFGLS